MIEELSPEEIGKHAASILRTAAQAARDIREEVAAETERVRAALDTEREVADAHAQATLERARHEAAAIVAGAEYDSRRKTQESEQLLTEACRTADDRLADAERLELLAHERKDAADRALEDAKLASRELIDSGRALAHRFVESAREEAKKTLAEARAEAEALLAEARRHVAREEKSEEEVRGRLAGAIDELRHLQSLFGNDVGPSNAGNDASAEVHLIPIRHADVLRVVSDDQ